MPLQPLTLTDTLPDDSIASSIEAMCKLRAFGTDPRALNMAWPKVEIFVPITRPAKDTREYSTF